MSGKTGALAGREQEERVLRLLQTNELPSWLCGPFWITKPCSPDDARGVDLWIGTTAGFVAIQVKCRSSKGRNRKFYAAKNIGYVTMRSHNCGYPKTDAKVFEELMKEITTMFECRQEKVVKSVCVC